MKRPDETSDEYCDRMIQEAEQEIEKILSRYDADTQKLMRASMRRFAEWVGDFITEP